MAVLVASNRLPVTIRRGPEGISLSDSIGGVATGMLSVQDGEPGCWIGWPGPTDLISEVDRNDLDLRLEQRRLVPVHLSREEVRGFYQGYSNGVIWPLFHYLVQQVPLEPRHWEEYDQVNQRFAETISERWTPGDEVWIHDYQLLRVPFHLRRLRPEARIGLFLHIPFPVFEVFRILPTRRLLLEGMLGADLLGFHTKSYAGYFTQAVAQLVPEARVAPGEIEFQGRRTRVGDFPMGIDVARFETPARAGDFGNLRNSLGGGSIKTLVGIDRLDYTKGIPRRLLAFRRLLLNHPEMREKVTLIQVAVPSRTGVKAYRKFRRQVDAMVGRINGLFGTPGWTPVRYLYRSFTQPELIGLFRETDAMVVAPVRDGMNLVAKEFVASRVDGDGVLVLSEFAGAADDMPEALIVNPYDIEGTAEAYFQALTMMRHERRARMRALRQGVRSRPVSQWAKSFLDELRAISRETEPVPRSESQGTLNQVLDRVRQSASLLLLLDYDGTLVPFADHPDEAVPDPDLLSVLAKLSNRPEVELHLVSGRQREHLEDWFGHLPVGLHAEHGTWSRPAGTPHWQQHQLARPVPYDELLGLLKSYTDRTPGALIERKSSGLTWHFRLAEPALGSRNAEKLIEEVERRLGPEQVGVLRGDRVVEFRPSGIHKGLVVRRLQNCRAPRELTLAFGDDMTDEEMFGALGEEGLSIHVGPNPSAAQLRLRDVPECRALLQAIADSRSVA